MLHPIRLPTEASGLLSIQIFQQLLIEKVCDPNTSEVQLDDEGDWLCAVWPLIEDAWVRRFWTNQKQRRAKALKRIAAATDEQKAAILEMCKSQWDCAKLYEEPCVHRIAHLSDIPVEFRNDIKCLLEDFYDPWFSPEEGYIVPISMGGWNVERHWYLERWRSANQTRVCPYCDKDLDFVQLDHFLPLDEFPALSCTALNLIPVCLDCNGVQQKGKKRALDLMAQNQTANWFHPYLRSAAGGFSIAADRAGGSGWSIRLVPSDVTKAPQFENLDKLLGIHHRFRQQAQEYLREAGTMFAEARKSDDELHTEESLRAHLKILAATAKAEIGRRGRSLLFSFIYNYCSDDEAQFLEIWEEYKRANGMS